MAATAFAALPAGARAETGRLADFTLRLTSSAPATPTGTDVHILLHRAGDPNAKPSPIRSAVIQLPSGLRFDSGAAPQCAASDEDFKAMGSDACPHDTELDVGDFSAITGFGPPVDPLTGDDHVFNGPNQLIEVITAKGFSASPAADRLMIDGSTLTAHPPMAPGGPPDGESAVRSIDFRIPVRTEGTRSLITTPPSCPAAGRWSTTGRFGFADGTSDTVTTVTPCRSRGGRAMRPALRLTVRPRHARAGAWTRFRVRVRSSAARCVRGATVRLAGRSARTDSRGRAVLAMRPVRPGVRRAVAIRHGCGRAVAHVRVMRPAR